MSEILSIEEQVKLYRGGVSICEIARRLGVYKTTVSRRFARLGITRRTPSEAIILSYQKYHAPAGRRKSYTANENFFDTITPESAYIIGFIQADGTITEDRFSISTSEKDKDFLLALAGYMGSNRPLQFVHYKLGNGYRLVVNSRKMADALRKWGIHSPRTWTASTHLDLLYNLDYWRGVIDGDGTLCTSGGKRIIRLVGSRPICEQFLNLVRHNRIKTSAGVCPTRRIFTVGFTGLPAKLTAILLYKNASLYLPRKMEIAMEWAK
jgi:hypothetical protein